MDDASAIAVLSRMTSRRRVASRAQAFFTTRIAHAPPRALDWTSASVAVWAPRGGGFFSVSDFGHRLARETGVDEIFIAMPAPDEAAVEEDLL
jgi:hypothetical protein